MEAQAGLAEGAGELGIAAASDVIEAVTEQDADGVGTAGEQRGNVEGFVVDGRAEVTPGGRENVEAD